MGLERQLLINRWHSISAAPVARRRSILPPVYEYIPGDGEHCDRLITHEELKYSFKLSELTPGLSLWKERWCAESK
jgi:hypothetical protein